MTAALPDLSRTAWVLSASQLRHLLAPVPDAMLILDGAGRIALLNAAAERLFGYPFDEVVGREVEVLLPEGCGPDLPPLGAALPSDLVLEVPARRRDGSRFEAGLRLGGLQAEEQTLLTVLVQDRSPASCADSPAAEPLHWARLDLLGKLAPSLAHELAQPLAALMNLAECGHDLAEAEGGEARLLRREIVAEIGREARRAARIVRAVHGFALRGQGTRSAENMAALVEEARDVALSGPEARRIQVLVEMIPGLRVMVDRTLVLQALVNLLRNAAEVLEGCARRELHIALRPRARLWVEVRVEDSGPGVPPALAPRIFSAAPSTKPGGLGLGLSICKDIVTAHGGTIWLENRHPHGATFAFTLPRLIDVNAYA